MNKSKRNKDVLMYGTGIGVFLALHYLIGLDLFKPIHKYITFLENLTGALAVVCIVLLIRTLVDRLIDKMDQSRGEQYNLRRILRFVSGVVIILVIVSFLFSKPYTTLAGLGIFSLVLGFALQAPITSFIGWLYIIFRQPYKVGDRIQISGHRGDVVEVSYLDTIIEECSGDYLENDRTSGRIIRFPNSLILKDKVVNYSGDFEPFIWNETAVQISYTSDLDFVEECLKKGADDDFKNRFPKKSITGNEADVYFRVNTYAWLEAVVSYPVEPIDTTGRRNRILKAVLPMLNTQPNKVGFPEGNTR